ncbi:MAG: condensation domain-containing protein, partial [Actinophytocola sp.]|uniref:condensation domain-containing protein n=1 Tax=Actinophytocola sp. TaxID=1872138 RepID=UPI003D6A987B
MTVTVSTGSRRRGTGVSPAQRGMWLADRMHPDSGMNNVFCLVRLVGTLDPEALRGAIADVVARHSALRSTFHDEDGTPVVRVADAVDVSLPVVEPSVSAERTRRLAQEWCERPFDLAAGPLVRTRLVRIRPREHLLCIAVHHIVCDGQSLAVLFGELSAAYATRTGAAVTAELPALSAQYGEYVAWRAAHVTPPVDWWASYLDGVPDLLPLPADRVRPPVRGGAGDTVVFDIPEQLADDLATLARRHRMSPFMVLLAVYGVVLGRLSDVRDLVVGIPVTDRPLPEFEPLIGMFVDTLPVRLTMPPGVTFADLLADVRRSVLGVLSHQHVSFDALVDLCGANRSPAHTPLVQAAFGADVAPFPAPVLSEVDVEVCTPLPTGAKFDLDVWFNAPSDGRGGLVGALTYSTELFERATADALAERFVHLLGAAVAEPSRRVDALPLTGPDERRTILERWGRGGPARSKELPVHEMFAQHAALAPDAPAVSAEGRELSYRELDARRRQIAGRLRRTGLGPDDVVGILHERDADMVAALLGILSAGAAYLPLSSTHPP